MLREYISDLKREFSGYKKYSLVTDLLSGITVAAVALPLALAFGVSSGADAAAGLITAIASSFIIGALSGASYQISGPTGAMAAILIPLAVKHGFHTILMAGMLSGIILIAAGVIKAGRITSFLPKSVITGFTSGIALIIALGQIENFLGVQSHGEESYMRIINMIKDGFTPNFYSIGYGLFVILLMVSWPKKWAKRVPASLVAVIIATGVEIIADFPVATVGAIPRTLIHSVRLSPASILNTRLDTVIMPAISIAALCMIESLLCGAVAGKMKGERLRGDRELVAQGIGNILLPFLGGVPATAAIARTSVAIKSGAGTRLAGIFQGVTLLLSMFLLSPFMSRIPMAALSGVLIVTAWRMNEWEGIKYIFKNKFKSAILQFLITLICTVLFDLTISIAVGCLISMLLYVIKVSNLEVTVSDFDPARLNKSIRFTEHVQVIYITGSIFFASADCFAEKAKDASGEILLLSMRGVPEVDASGAQELLDFCKDKMNNGTGVLFCGVQPKVKSFFDRAGITDFIGEDNFYWEAAEAFLSLDSTIDS
ncbi:MAG: SulP family inorganic anion transporter [Oscillospiraceae bacterium]|jgi:SulP family sulfate permease|nr:SulP family inorganic anion transporter [Oscillospiraceae bacterium]